MLSLEHFQLSNQVIQFKNVDTKTFITSLLLPFFAILRHRWCRVRSDYHTRKSGTLQCTVLTGSSVYYSIVYCTVLYCTVLYCTVLYCTVLYCTVLYCIVLYCTAYHIISDQIRSYHIISYHIISYHIISYHIISYITSTSTSTSTSNNIIISDLLYCH